METAEFLIGFVAVVWLAARRFNAPRPVRTYTRPERYFWGSLAYVTTGAVLYVFAYFLARTVLPQAYAAFGAVVLMGLAIRLPGVSRLDRGARESLQRAIGYPTEAHRLAAALAIAPFAPTAKVGDELKVLLQARGYDLDDDWLPVAEPVRELWFRAAALFQQVRGWERDARFDGFVWLARDEFDVLRQRFDQLSLKVVRVLETIEQLGRFWVCANGESAGGKQQSDPSGAAQTRMGTDLRTIISRLLADLRQDVAFFNQNLCLFAARGVLTQCVSARGRHRQLAGLGFKLAPEGPSTAKVLALTFAFYFVVFLVFMTPALKVVLTGGLPEARVLSKIALIALIQVVGVTAAVVPKPLFGFANENLRGETPWRFVLGAGVVAALLGLALQYAYHSIPAVAAGARGCVQIGGFKAVLPWLAMPFATASTLAFLIQDGRWPRIDSPFVRRLADVLVMVVALGLALVFARGAQYLLIGCDWRDPERDAWLIGVIAVGVGYMIPHTFRHPLRRTMARRPTSVSTSVAPAASRAAPLGART